MLQCKKCTPYTWNYLLTLRQLRVQFKKMFNSNLFCRFRLRCLSDHWWTKVIAFIGLFSYKRIACWYSNKVQLSIFSANFKGNQYTLLDCNWLSQINVKRTKKKKYIYKNFTLSKEMFSILLLRVKFRLQMSTRIKQSFLVGTASLRPYGDVRFMKAITFTGELQRTKRLRLTIGRHPVGS